MDLRIAKRGVILILTGKIHYKYTTSRSAQVDRTPLIVRLQIGKEDSVPATIYML